MLLTNRKDQLGHETSSNNAPLLFLKVVSAVYQSVLDISA